MSRSCREVERRILRHLHDCKTRTQLPQIHAQFLRHNLQHSSQILSHFLAVCGSLRQMKYANSVFLQFQNIMVYALMINNGLCPNDSTFVGVLACCVHAGLVQRGRVLFDQMISNHHLKPKQEHYGCMVDLLGRNGFVDEAHELIGSMTIKPNAALWGALLSACRIHGNTELAERATKELINLEPWNSGNYVLLSNIYAERGRWDEVEKVRLEMAGYKIKKAPGHSMVG